MFNSVFNCYFTVTLIHLLGELIIGGSKSLMVFNNTCLWVYLVGSIHKSLYVLLLTQYN